MRRKINILTTLLNHIVNVDLPALQTSVAQISGQVTALEKRVADLAHALTLAITAPASGATVSGTVTFTATCTCPSAHAIKSVTFYIWDERSGWVQIVEDVLTPFTTTFDSTQYSNGTHKLRAVGACVSGGSSSVEITITIDNTIPAGGTTSGGSTSGYGCVVSISVDSPTPGSVVSGIFQIIGDKASSVGHAFPDVPGAITVTRVADGTAFSGGLGPAGWVATVSLRDAYSDSFRITIKDVHGESASKTVTYYNAAYVNTGQTGWRGSRPPV